MEGGKSTWKDDAYAGAAMYGRFKAVMSAVIGVIIFSLMIVFSVPFLGTYTKYSKSVSAKITGLTTEECEGRIVHGENSSYRKYDCLFNVEYKIGDETYEKNGVLVSSTRRYTEGETVTIYYNPQNPDDITSTYHVNPHTIAVACIFGGVVGIISTLGYTYFVMKYDSIAAVTGAAHGINDLKRSMF